MFFHKSFCIIHHYKTYISTIHLSNNNHLPPHEKKKYIIKKKIQKNTGRVYINKNGT